MYYSSVRRERLTVRQRRPTSSTGSGPEGIVMLRFRAWKGRHISNPANGSFFICLSKMPMYHLSKPLYGWYLQTSGCRVLRRYRDIQDIQEACMYQGRNLSHYPYDHSDCSVQTRTKRWSMLTACTPQSWTGCNDTRVFQDLWTCVEICRDKTF